MPRPGSRGRSGVGEPASARYHRRRREPIGPATASRPPLVRRSRRPGGDAARRPMARRRRGRPAGSGTGSGALAPRRRSGGGLATTRAAPVTPPVSVRWIREGAPSREQERWRDRRPGHRGPAIPVDPESGHAGSGAAPRSTPAIGPPDRRPECARPADRPARRIELDDGGGPGDESAAARRWAREQVAMRADRSNSIMRMPPRPRLGAPPDEAPATGGTVATCPTGSAGSSCAPASTASRATCRSTRAACS